MNRTFLALHLFSWLLLISGTTASYSQDDKRVFRGGAAAVDISPIKFPVIVNGSFEQRTANGVVDRLMSRAMILDDGETRIAIVVVDNLMIKRDLLDRAKAIAERATGIPSDKILISATHTHSAPSAMGCLGSDADPAYVDFLPGQIAKSIIIAAENLVPARIGWTAVKDEEHTHCRRWIFRPDRMASDPFGRKNVRAHMHPGHQSGNHTGPSGPADPDLSLLALETTDGKPLVVLGNYATHYYGSGSVSADFCGRFGDKLAELIDAKSSSRFVGIMSQGTSGDGMWMDYSRPAPRRNIDNYTSEVAKVAANAYRNIKFHDWVPLNIAETKLKLGRRVPDEDRLAWARKTYPDPLNTPSDGRLGKQKIYAREALFLHGEPQVELKLQAVRIGDLGITAIPNEVYAITGLKLKAQSPLATTFNIELANGAQGYIPPPEQHALGGYTTWPARTAGLEVQAEPKIVETLLTLLEQASGKTRKAALDPPSDYAKTIIAAKPLAYWRLGDLVATKATDAMGRHDAIFEGGVAMFLRGPKAEGISTGPRGNRAVHFAGGHLRTSLKDLDADYTVSFWFWNGLPSDVRPVTGTLWTLGEGKQQESLAIGGNSDPNSKGKLVLRVGGRTSVGVTAIRTAAWHQVVIVRESRTASVFLNGKLEAEMSDAAESSISPVNIRIGGASQTDESFEGKIDEVAIFNRALKSKEIGDHYAVSNMTPPREPQPKTIIPGKPSDVGSLDRYSRAVLKSRPVAYWRLHDEKGESKASNEVSDLAGEFEKGSFPHQPGGKEKNFAGGRLKFNLSDIGDTYAVEFWFRNALPHHARPVTGYMFSRGEEGSRNASGDHLGIGGTHGAAGRLIVFNGNQRNQLLEGVSELIPRSWNHVVMIREQKKVTLFLNGRATPEIEGVLPRTYPDHCAQMFVGGRCENFANFQGTIDEVAVYDRVLSPDEIRSHFAASGAKIVTNPRSSNHDVPRALSVARSMRQIKIRDGFELQLVAAEPLVKDPVAIDWEPDGKLWVVEMADYPLGMDGEGKAGGRIRFLEDTNGDGHYDSSTLFADMLSFPTGILTWRDGVLVTAAPDILYLKDTDGDGKADRIEKLYSGFLEGNQQLRVNGLRWGLDNWVHCASGSHHAGYGKGNQITSHQTNRKVRIGSRDFRIRPDVGSIDPQSGPSQFGRNRDDWGNWFGVQNSHPLWHYVLADHYIRRNPNFAPPDPRQQVITPANPKVYPAKPPQKRFHSFGQSGRFTSACSAMIYRDDLLFARGDQQHAFTCEPFHNLVQHNLIIDDGVSFRFERDPAETRFDFFASADRWCRPVMARTGPDGALWVVDMYRYMIEHPQWLPKNGQDELRPYFRHGENQGRIYRIVPDGKPPRGVPGLDKLSTQELVKVFESPNGPLRDMTQRKLIASKNKAAVEPLQNLLHHSKQPLARLHALCTLEGLNALTSETVEQSLSDKHPAVRRHAVRLSEGHAADITILAKLVGDPDAKVRLQLACTLGYFDEEKAGKALADLAVATASDPYTNAAVISSINRKNLRHVLISATSNRDENPSDRLYGQLFSQAATIGEEKIVADAIRLATEPINDQYAAWQYSSLAQMLDVLARRGWRLSDRLPKSISVRVDSAKDRARKQVVASKTDETIRVAAIRLLLRDPEWIRSDLELVTGLLVPQTPKNVQHAMVAHAAMRSEPQIAAAMLDGWVGHGPSLRADILNVIASRETWMEALLRKIEAGKVLIGEIDAPLRQRLLTTKNKSHQARLRKLLADPTSEDRRQLITRYQAARQLRGVAKRGIDLFAKRCANCHRYGTEGKEVGPNLAALTNKSSEALLNSILDPSSAVESKYLSYTLVTIDGHRLAGMIETETGSSITLLTTEGKRLSLLRSEIDELQSSGKSLMPDGLEKDLTIQEFADLMEFVRSMSDSN